MLIAELLVAEQKRDIGSPQVSAKSFLCTAAMSGYRILKSKTVKKEIAV